MENKQLPRTPCAENIDPNSVWKRPRPPHTKLPTPLAKRLPMPMPDTTTGGEPKRSRLDIHQAAVRKPKSNLRRSKSMVSVNQVLTSVNQPMTRARLPPVQHVQVPAVSQPVHRTTSMCNVSGPKSQGGTAGTKGVSADNSAPPVVVKPGRRQAWDLKGRIEDLEKAHGKSRASNASLNVELEQAINQAASLQAQNGNLREVIADKDEQLCQIRAEAGQLKAFLRAKELQLVELQACNSVLEGDCKEMQRQMDSTVHKCGILEATVAEMSVAQTSAMAQISTAMLQINGYVLRTAELERSLSDKESLIDCLQQDVNDRDVKIRADETERRKLHNAIQELKGNIRVFCRVRPQLPSESADHSTMAAISYLDEQRLDVCHGGENFKGRGSNTHEFKFDRVFSPRASQDKVFGEISELIQSALDGYNVCVFAYGQTGSGKTYTMEGPESCLEEQAGMIPRAVEQVFDSIKLLQCRGWKYEMAATFLEVYNETIRDLLGNGKDDKKHDIKMAEVKGGDVYVSNVTPVPIVSEAQIFKLLRQARDRRAVAATRRNDRSSRSHSVFQLKLSGSNGLTGETCEGTLNLVDLAGSERLKESHSEGERLRETKSINKSLSSLGNVFVALAQKADHVPYRSSKLTHLLMNSLGGNSKTLMFVNVSPKEDHLNETLNSLRFATKVNQCHIGTAQRKLK